MLVANYEIDTLKIAAPVVERLLGRAISHILSNEASSHVLSKVKRAIVGADGDPESVTADGLESWRAVPQQAAQEASWKDDYCLAKIASMYDGTLSVRTASARAPSRDPVEVASRAIAKAELVVALKAQGAKFPVKDEIFTLIADGVDHTFTGDEMIDRRLAHESHGPRILAAAKKKVRDAEREREAAQKAAADGGLGLF